jgi:chromosome segregation ATPase
MERQRLDLVEGLRRGELPSRGGTPIKSNRFDSTSRGGTPIKLSRLDFEGQLGPLTPTQYTRSGVQDALVDGSTARHAHDADEPMQMDRYVSERDALSVRLREAEAGLESVGSERDALSVRLREAEAGLESVGSERDALSVRLREAEAGLESVGSERDALSVRLRDAEAGLESVGSERDALSVRLREAEAGLKAFQDEAQDLRVDRARLVEALDEASKNALATEGGEDARIFVEERVVRAMFEDLREKTIERVRGLGEGLSLVEILIDSFESQLSGLNHTSVESEGRVLEMGYGGGSESEGGAEEGEGEENVLSDINGEELTVADCDEDEEEIYKVHEAQHLQKRVSELETDLKGKDDEAQNLQKRVSELEADLKRKDGEAQNLQINIDMLERQREEAKSEATELMKKIQELEKVMGKELEEARASVEVVWEEKERQVEGLRVEVARLEDRAGAMNEEVVRLEKDKKEEVARLVEENVREVMRLRERVASLEDERGTLKEEVMRLTSVMAGIEGSHRVIRDAVGDALEAERDAVSEGRDAIRRASERHHLFARGGANQGRERGDGDASERVYGVGGGGGWEISKVEALEGNRGRGGIEEEDAGWELETLKEHVVTIEGLLTERELEIDNLLEQVDSLRSRSARDL